MTGHLAAYVVAFIVAVALVPASSVLAHRFGALAPVRVDRWHSHPIPVLGGLAIAGGVLAGAVLLGPDTDDLLAVTGGMAVMTTLGLADDLRPQSPITRLVVEAFTAAAFAWLVTPELDGPIRMAAVALASLCIPVAVNAVNLVDNADGLAAAVSTLTALTLAAIVGAVGIASDAGAIALVIAAASAGFLVHNRPPARVFMGDSGSLMLGFGLAACSVLIVRDALLVPGSAHAAAAIAVPLAWAIQVGDLGMVFVTRLRRGASPFRGDTDHTSHRLIAAGVGPGGMLLLMTLLAAAIGATAVLLAAAVGDYRLVTIAVAALALGVAAFEVLVAWRLPYRRTSVRPADPASDPGALDAGGSEGGRDVSRIRGGPTVGRRTS